MKQILFIGMSPNKGGVETFMMNVFLRLEGENTHFTFLNIYKRDLAYQNIIYRHHGDVIHLNLNTSFIGHLYRYNTALDFFHQHRNYDIVYVNAITIDVLFWIKAARKCGIKELIIHSHNSGRKNTSKMVTFFSFFLSRYNKIWLKFHSNIIKLAASNSCGKWMFGKNSKFTVINNGINPKEYKYNSLTRINMRKKLKMPLNSKVLITTGRLAIQKNYKKILNVFNEVHHINHNTYLIIAGNGDLMPFVKEFILQHKLCSCVYLLGSVKHAIIPQLLNTSDLMIMPSFYEAVPFSLTEAQASGVPALVSLEGIPKEANITGKVNFMSLEESDLKWAKTSLKIIRNNSGYNMKIKMNNVISHSNFDINTSLKKLKDKYL